ncbi:MAG: hypothetical protein U0Q16_18955 [Bryobacteraceae bacterium]
MRHAAFIWLSILPAFAGRQVAIVAEGELAPPARHGLAKLEQALAAKGLTVAHGAPSDRAPADFYVLASVGKGAPQSVSIHRSRHRGKPAIALSGGDARGLMYAALDVADHVRWSQPNDPFAKVRDAAQEPYLVERGVSIYTMQRAYFESRLYDEKHWERYFDLLAASRINNFIVIFGYENGGFMAPLYPYFFNVSEYPGVMLDGITAEQQTRNTAAFKAMIRIAHERGIDVTAGIWDHIYRGGVQGGGIPGASENAGKRVPGLVWGVTAENLPGYTKAALRKFLAVFPEVDAIQFRMHDESGLKHEEMAGFWHEVFSFIKAAKPDMRLDLRVKDLPHAVIEDALDQGLKARVNTKYWMEQVGLPFHPTHVNTQNQHDRRHGYADLLRYPQRYRVQWQLWTGGTTRLLLWGDPEYVRRFAASARLYDGNSFELNEMLATKMLGEKHDQPPLAILEDRYRYYDYEFERYWAFYRMWGRLSYDPRTDPEVWRSEFEARFGAAGPHVMKALEAASRVLPRIVAAAYRYQYFPTTRGWIEMNHQDSLARFATADNTDIQQFESTREEARSILAGTDTAMRRPQETARWFAQTAGEISAELALAEKAIGGKQGNEFISTATDLKILAGLARYYAARLPAAVAYNVYKQSGDTAAFDEAIRSEQRALEAWRGIAAAAGDVYTHRLAFGAHAVGFRQHWKEELALFERDVAELEAERARVPDKPGHALTPRDPALRPPVVALGPPVTAEPGRDLRVWVKIASPAGVKWARLRYRHMTQYEDYQTAEMTLDAKSGSWVAAIPAAFIDPKWDLMYFIEAVGKNGAGRMYPDFEREMPYVVVPVKR